MLWVFCFQLFRINTDFLMVKVRQGQNGPGTWAVLEDAPADPPSGAPSVWLVPRRAQQADVQVHGDLNWGARLFALGFPLRNRLSLPPVCFSKDGQLHSSRQKFTLSNWRRLKTRSIDNDGVDPHVLENQAYSGQTWGGEDLSLVHTYEVCAAWVTGQAVT